MARLEARKAATKPTEPTEAERLAAASNQGVGDEQPLVSVEAQKSEATLMEKGRTSGKKLMKMLGRA